MVRSIKIIFVCLVPLLLVFTAYATKPAPASGDFELVDSTITGIKNADGNTIITLNATFNLTGTFNGIFVEDVKQIIKPTGKGTIHGQGTFYGTVNGASGSMVFRVDGTIDGSAAQGHFVILSGTDGLANLHGQGTFEQVGTTGTYSAQIHFDPD